VIDLVQLIRGQPCPPRMSSRMVVVDYPSADGKRPLGLLAEQITDVDRIDDKAPEEPGVTIPDARYLGRVFRTSSGLVQLVEVKALLSAQLRAMLWNALEGTIA
jgi:chemotaxis-related protein WspB